MEILLLIVLAVLPTLVIVAGLRDLTTMTIPNWISALLVIGFYPVALLVGLDPMSLLIHTGVGLAALFAGAGMFALRWIGGGDAKLMAAACLWLGVQASGMFLLWTGVMGGLFCLGLIFARSHYSYRVAGVGPVWLDQLLQPKADIPYGVAIAAGALLAFPDSPVVLAFATGL